MTGKTLKYRLRIEYELHPSELNEDKRRKRLLKDSLERIVELELLLKRRIEQ